MTLGRITAPSFRAPTAMCWCELAILSSHLKRIQGSSSENFPLLGVFCLFVFILTLQIWLHNFSSKAFAKQCPLSSRATNGSRSRRNIYRQELLFPTYLSPAFPHISGSWWALSLALPGLGRLGQWISNETTDWDASEHERQGQGRSTLLFLSPFSRSASLTFPRSLSPTLQTFLNNL